MLAYLVARKMGSVYRFTTLRKHIEQECSCGKFAPSAEQTPNASPAGWRRDLADEGARTRRSLPLGGPQGLAALFHAKPKKLVQRWVSNLVFAAVAAKDDNAVK